MQSSKPTEIWKPEAMPAMVIATAARLLARLADVRLRDLGISTSHFPVLVALKDGARLSQKELARLAAVEQPSMAQLLARMERDGLIRREPDPADGRSSLISLTDSAIDRIAPARAILAQGNREALAGFNEDDIERLIALLRRVIANVSDGNDGLPAGGRGSPRITVSPKPRRY
jgi:MarR family transcriptional regulator, transcriptional regulator for hemolysin